MAEVSAGNVCPADCRCSGYVTVAGHQWYLKHAGEHCWALIMNNSAVRKVVTSHMKLFNKLCPASVWWPCMWQFRALGWAACRRNCCPVTFPSRRSNFTPLEVGCQSNISRPFSVKCWSSWALIFLSWLPQMLWLFQERIWRITGSLKMMFSK